jgi:2-polyprenyl-3-methyl-5-hydroxy-6-metoxy-1,4-benzoquinol methylase
MSVRTKIDDAEWFELQFDPARAKAQFGIALPGFPDEPTQISFTGMAGRPNLQQAFSFYSYARDVSGLDRLSEPRIMDFGAGWGRIARFFLRDTAPQNIVTADTMRLAITCLKDTGGPFQIVHNPPAPPIPKFQQTFDLIYSYSVFSHLSEKFTRLWLDYLLTLLQPGGRLVFTTRGAHFINDLEHIRSQSEEFVNSQKGGVAEYLQFIRKHFPDPALVRERRASGAFQFFLIGGHHELVEDCTGETVIPKAYFEKHYSSYLASFREDVPNVDQSVVVLSKANQV